MSEECGWQVGYCYIRMQRRGTEVKDMQRLMYMYRICLVFVADVGCWAQAYASRAPLS